MSYKWRTYVAIIENCAEYQPLQYAHSYKEFPIEVIDNIWRQKLWTWATGGTQSVFEFADQTKRTSSTVKANQVQEWRYSTTVYKNE